MYTRQPTAGSERRPVREGPALLALLITAAVLAGCASSATTGALSGSPAHSQASGASTSAAAADVFISRHYGYTAALPAGWLPGAQATQQWNGKGAPGSEDSVVDLFDGPGSVQAWALAVPTKESLAAFARATIRAAAAHSCPAVPQTDEAITIGGAPARLLTMQCPAGSGFLVETAVTIHAGTAFVFASQNPLGAGADHSADRAAFRNFLGGIGLSR